MAHNHHRQFDYNNPQPLPYQPDRYSRWKIHPTTETRRERVNPPRSLYAYNAGHQPARRPSCWEPPPYQQDRNPYVSRQPESHPDIPYRTAPPQLREQEPPYWLNEFAAIDGEQHRRARQPWREPQLPSFADGPDPRRIHTVGYRGRFHDQPQPQTIDNNWDQGGWHDRGDRRQRQGFEAYPWRHQQPHSGRAEQLRQPSCYDPPQSRQPSCWEPQPRRASREYSDYDKPPLGPPSRWDLPDYRCPQTLQPTQSDRPLSHRTAPCPAHLDAVSDYNEKLRVYRLEQASLLAQLNAWLEENIDDENLVEDVPNNAVHNAGANLDVDVPINESREEIVKTDNVPLQVLVGVCDEKIGDLIVPTHREVALLDDVEDDNSTDEMKMVVASLNDVQVSSKNVVGICWGKKEDGSYTGLPIIACVYMDLNVGDVTSMNHRPTSLDTDARLIPPRNETSCLGILRGVEKLFVLVWNFADHIGSSLLIFDGVEEGRHSVVRCVFDPGGDASPRLLLSTLYVASWFPP